LAIAAPFCTRFKSRESFYQRERGISSKVFRARREGMDYKGIKEAGVQASLLDENG